MSKKEAGNQGFCLIIRFPIDQRWSNINSAASTWDSLQTKAGQPKQGQPALTKAATARVPLPPHGLPLPATGYGLAYSLGPERSTNEAFSYWFLTAILHRGLCNCVFLRFIYFFQFLFGLLFLFFIWIFLFQYDFNSSFNSSFNSFLFLFYTNRGHILDFFQIFSWLNQL